MPELPEVETLRRQLAPHLIGRTIVDAGCFSSAKFTDAPHAVGAGVRGLERRGKYLLAGLDDDRELVVHLGMTGQLSVVDRAEPEAGHLRAWWSLDDGRVLRFRDARRFGRIAVVPAGSYERLPTLAELGPEPLDPTFTAEEFARRLGESRRRVKTSLLSQRPVAGVGNIYADEALWQARVYPARRRITRPQAGRLLDALRDTLRNGIANGGTTLRDYRTLDGGEGSNQYHLRCYGRADEPCERCGDLLRRRVWDARSTTFCPTCQKP